MNIPTQDVFTDDSPTRPAQLVQITIVDVYGNVDSPDTPLSKRNHDTVRWFNQTSDPAFIVFHTKKHSPLDDDLLTVLPGQFSKTENIKNAVPGDDTPYKYTVLAVDGVNDPTVIINR